MIKAVIFDLSGVIIFPAKLNPALRRMARLTKTKRKKFLECFYSSYNIAKLGKMTENQLFRNVIADCRIRFNINRLKNELRKHKRKNLSILNLIKGLRQKGIKTALLSNTVKEWFIEDAKFVNLASLFDTIIVSFEEGIAKPNHKIYKTTAKRLGVQLKDCILVDDLERNIKGAKKIGMKGIVYKNVNDLKKKLKIKLGDQSQIAV